MDRPLLLDEVVSRVTGIFPVSVDVSEIPWGFSIRFLDPISFVRLYHLNKLQTAFEDYKGYEPRVVATIDDTGQPVAYVELFRY